MKKNKGRIIGDEVGFFPCLWIGLTNPFHVKEISEPGLKRGQFLFQHQYMGCGCRHVDLFGAIFPIFSCNDTKIMASFYKLERKYSNLPWSLTIDQLVHIRRDLKAIGPLDCNTEYELSGEAFLTFSFNDEAYTWIKKHFKMVTEIRESESHLPVEIAREENLRFKDEKAFVDWFRYDESIFFPFWLKGAFVYENSD